MTAERHALAFAIGLLLAALPVRAAPPPVRSCPPDAVRVGPTCVDTYEASIWRVPRANVIGNGNAGLIEKIRRGTATLADLRQGRAMQISPSSSCSPPFPETFPGDGNWTRALYAVSIAGVKPTACVTWFQAQQACLLSGKRLLTNAEWQGAAAGTPDPGTDNGTTDCAVASAAVVPTGSRAKCRSRWGAFDLVGNVAEWVADWTALSTSTCTDWTTQAGIAGGDLSCFGGVEDTARDHIPGALIRGGTWNNGKNAGVFAVNASVIPSFSSPFFGFRCGR